MKPAIRQIKPRQPPETKLERARRRHGKPFAFESGTTWTPRETPLLTEWMATRTKEKQ